MGACVGLGGWLFECDKTVSLGKYSSETLESSARENRGRFVMTTDMAATRKKDVVISSILGYLCLCAKGRYQTMKPILVRIWAQSIFSLILIISKFKRKRALGRRND